MKGHEDTHDSMATTGSPAWRRLLAEPAPGQHIAQLYTESRCLARAVAVFVAGGVRAGDGVVAIARPAHWAEIARRLEGEGVVLEGLERRGQLAVLDAAESLAALLVDGMPDPGRFDAVVGDAVRAVRRAGYPRIRAFGEMVDLLRRADLAATIRLEELWNFLAGHGIALLCGYSLDAFDPRVYRGLVQRVCSVHSDLVPVEDDACFEQAVEHAYAETFGSADDGRLLRHTLLADYVRPAVMPDAAAAILAAREFVPIALDALLDTARRHYRATMAPHAGE